MLQLATLGAWSSPMPISNSERTPPRMEPTAGLNGAGAAAVTLGRDGVGPVDPPASAAPDRNDSSETAS